MHMKSSQGPPVLRVVDGRATSKGVSCMQIIHSSSKERRERGLRQTLPENRAFGEGFAPQSPSYYCEYFCRWGSCVQIRCEILSGSAELLVLLRVLGPVRVSLQIIPAHLALSANC